MARPTSSGLPYLVRRNDTRKFAYWRTIAREVAPKMAGSIQLSWSTSNHVLAGNGSTRLV